MKILIFIILFTRFLQFHLGFCTDPDMELTNEIPLKVNKRISDALQMSLCKLLKNKVCGPCFHLVLGENVRIKKSWSETKVYWQFNFPGSWVLLSNASCQKALKIFAFGHCNPVYLQPKMNVHKTFDAESVHKNVFYTSIWGSVASLNISRNF